MTKLSSLYYQKVLKDHLWRILSRELLLSLAVAGTFFFLTGKAVFTGKSLPLETLAKMVSTNATLGLAAALTVTSMLVRLVAVDFVEQVSERVASFEFLVFRLSLTKLACWLILLASSLCPLFTPANFNLLDPAAPALARLEGAGLVFGFCYVVFNYLGLIQLVSILAIIRVAQKSQSATGR